MAKYDVTMSCGHEQTVQLFGKMADRDKKIAWLEKHGLCDECKKAETERKHAEATAKAAEKAIAENLPELTGTEKQVNWALTIREKMLAEVDKKIEDNKDRMDADKLATAELQAKAIKKVVANKFTEARFWIDNRDSILQIIIKNHNLAEEIKAEIANLQAEKVENVTADENIAEVENNIEENAVEEIAEVENVTTNADNTATLIIEEQNYRNCLKEISATKKKITELEALNKNYTKAIAEKHAEIATYPDYNLTWEQRKNCIEFDELQDKQERTAKDLVVLRKHLKTQNEIIMQKAFIAINAVAAEIEDDGSNDDYDEDEIVTVDSTDNDDDEDELVDEPIETAESKEETEMKEVKAPASATTETVKFEVGKVYYPCGRSENPKIKITKRTAKTVHYKVERHTGEFDCETRANISIWDGVEHFYSGYTSASYYANDAAETATETVETENVVNEEDSATVKTAKEELIYVNNQIKGVQRNIAYYVEQIKEYLGCIAKCENFISNYGVDLRELQNKAAALENEIANLKLIDTIDDIGGSEDAVNASVEAMIELNAANDFTAANLLDAVNAQAENAGETAPVTFELQNFAEDEDTEIKKQFAEITELAHREKEIEQKIAALQEELNAVHREYVKKDWKLTKYAKDLMDAVYQTVKTAFEKRTEFGYIQINGIMMTSWHWDEYNAVRTQFDKSGFALWFYDDTAPRGYQFKEIVTYSTIKQFKAAIRGLVAAIERGETKFTFPADGAC